MLSLLRFVLRVLAAVGGQASADVVALLEAAVAIAADVALVASGIDQFAGHDGTPTACLIGESTNEGVGGFEGSGQRRRIGDKLAQVFTRIPLSMFA